MVRARVLGVLFVGVALIAAGFAYYVASTGSGTIRIQVRDVPASWSHVTVAFSEARVHRAGSTNDSGWVDLGLAQTRVDLLSLGNDTTLMALGHAPSGTYGEVCIVISSAVGIATSGTAVTMEVPDGIILTTTPFVLRGGGTTTVTIDLDLAQSIRQSSGMWVFTPVLGAVLVS